jgi:hypothetical protein
MSIYDSLPLPDDGRSIRLLIVQPSRDQYSQVTCVVEVPDTDHQKKYEALSYCWGDPTIRETLKVNSKDISVTGSLYSALRALRLKDGPRTLWVDALCIDQSNIPEKSYQVPLMALIYRNCTRTIIWLGESDQDSRKAFESIHKGNNTYPKALTSVLRRPWFSRIWIVQEVALAPIAFIQCGQDVLEWDQLFKAALLVNQLGSMVNPRSSGGMKHLHPAFFPLILDSARTRVKNGELFDLHEALRSFQPFSATMAVDKVYGIMGLLRDPSLVEVDYTLSPKTVYQRIAFAAINHTRTVDIFLDCLQSINGPSIPGLPSWVPDWSATDQPLDNPLSTVFAKEEFQPSGVEARQPICHDDSLLVSGCFIGQIAELGIPIPSVQDIREKYWPAHRRLPLPHRRAFEGIGDIVNVFQSWKDVTMRTRPGCTSLSDSYATGETMQEALYHTVQMNGRPFVCIEAAREFDKWIATIETMMGMVAFYATTIVRYLPWPLVWMVSGPYFMSYSMFIVLQLVRGEVVMDAPNETPDSSRQNSVVGRIDAGLVGLFPAPSLTAHDALPALVGDDVVIFKGATRPYVVRKVGDRWKIVGCAYVHGIMYGAAFEENKCVDIWLI